MSKEYLERRYGVGTLMTMASSEPPSVLPTGIDGLDEATGIGGYPRGRVIEVFGPEMSGKTTLALHAIAQIQISGGLALFVDTEHALDPRYAERIGVDLRELLVSQPDNAEMALDIVEQMIGTANLIIVDSVAALCPRVEVEGEMGDMMVGLRARLMSKALRKLTARVSQNDCIIIFTNQLRPVMGMTFGPSEVTTGGNALKFYSSLRLDLRKIGSRQEDGQTITRHRVRVVKNKLAPPFRQAEFDLDSGVIR